MYCLQCTLHPCRPIVDSLVAVISLAAMNFLLSKARRQLTGHDCRSSCSCIRIKLNFVPPVLVSLRLNCSKAVCGFTCISAHVTSSLTIFVVSNAV